MEKGAPPSLFVNDGSFMERFKQLQQEQQEKEKTTKSGDAKPIKVVPGSLAPNPSLSKASNAQKMPQGASGGKLAFSLKQKSKLVPPPVKLTSDEDEEEAAVTAANDTRGAPSKRQKLGQVDGANQLTRAVDVAPASPSDPTVKNAADKLASFVAKTGRQFEDVTRQKNPGDTPFKFLFDRNCADYKYYEHRLAQEEKDLTRTREAQTANNGGMSSSSSRLTSSSKRSADPYSSYQVPASALYEGAELSSAGGSSAHSQSFTTVSGTQSSNDSLAMMEFYMKKAAQEEKWKQPKQSKDEMPPPPSLHGKRGHHMGDYIPPEELDKFMASCNDVAAQKAAKEAAERARIQADNVGHRLLSKMGWKEGEGLGGSNKGISDPIMAGGVKSNNLGVGAHNPGEVTPEDDIYEQYKKRMMLGYRHRPNPLNNPRKAYY